MATTADAQTQIDEQIIDDAELEQALEDREIAKGKSGEARKKYKTMDDLVKGKLGDVGLEDGDVARVGRFRISKSAVSGRAVSFDTSPTSRVLIAPVGEDD